ncbi:FmdB family zinc ribbon protein [Microbacterium sp.]|uniref:FmdB family zinc ribbon protein n=1 Tax=Microbacterium sp. TaxID=51671 RepID=UPI0039E282A4
MPTYSYACTQCGHSFDAVQSFSDAALTDCPECDGRLRKQYGSVGVTFNGSGFYRTDSRAKQSDAAAGAKAGSTPSSSAGASISPASTGS